MHIGQSVVASLMAECQLLVVKPKQVHASGVEVVDMHFVFNDAESELVGRAIGVSSFHAASCHPNAEALFMMVAARGGELSGTGSLYHTSLPSAFSAGVRGVDHGCRVWGGEVGGFPLDEPELHSNDGTFIHAMTA
jgi:hypothetical protein